MIPPLLHEPGVALGEPGRSPLADDSSRASAGNEGSAVSPQAKKRCRNAVARALRQGLFRLLLGVSLAFAVEADYQAGLEAYQRGEYDRAFTEWMVVVDSPPGSVHPGVLAETLYALGMLYWVGQGVQQDTVVSASWLRRAAELNHPGAQAKLGYLYSSGQGVAQSDFAAFKWLQMAANQGDADAQYNLGVFYREGVGVDVNGTEALKWFREAASNGDAESALIVSQYEAGATVSGAAGRSLLADDSSRASAGNEGSAVSPQAKKRCRNAVARALLQEPGSVLEEAWIRGRDPQHYTIQVIALLDPGNLRDFIERHPDWAPFAIYRQQWQGKPLWVLVQGDYPDVAQARAAVRDFPAGLQKPEDMWIRRFKMVQGLLP